ncbi:MAG: hypothetical protein RBS88_06595 [Spongiibacteraceae bacterium]|jgi:MFS family permease|nr:hypothetical protein [Spongiibacteraceae bacterium]
MQAAGDVSAAAIADAGAALTRRAEFARNWPVVANAAAGCGIAMGAEADLLGYFTARYFGIATYGRAYSWQYSAFIVAAGLSPVWIGRIFDTQGSYHPALLISAALLAVALVFFLLLPPFARRPT